MHDDITIVRKSLDELIPYENNPRNNDEAVPYVAASMRDFGCKVPLVIDKDGVIVAGHTRYKAARSLGWTHVPCIVADDLSDEQVKAFRLADNKVAEVAEWDDEMLSVELDDIIGIDMEAYGFDMDDEEGLPAELDDVEEKEIELINVKMEFKSRNEWNKVEERLRQIVDEIDGVSITVGGGIL